MSLLSPETEAEVLQGLEEVPMGDSPMMMNTQLDDVEDLVFLIAAELHEMGCRCPTEVGLTNLGESRWKCNGCKRTVEV